MTTAITKTVLELATQIETYFEARGFEWKSKESQSEHEQTKPVVFPFVCTDRNEWNFPKRNPSITIELIDVNAARSELSLNVMFHCVVVNSAILEREKTIQNGDTFEFQTIEGFTEEETIESLFKDCLLLAEETMNAIKNRPNISNVKLIAPQTVDDFPFCQCQISANVTMLSRYDDAIDKFL